MEPILSYDQLVFSFAVFIFEIAERLIRACVAWGILIGLFYFIFKCLIFKKSPEMWDEFAASVRSGIKDAAGAFKEVMVAIREQAKYWAKSKIRELRGEQK